MNNGFTMFGGDYQTWWGGFALCFFLPAVVAGVASFGLLFVMTGGTFLPSRPLGSSYSFASAGISTFVGVFSMLFHGGYMRLITLRLRGYHATTRDCFNFNGQAGPLLLYGLLYAGVYNGLSVIPAAMLADRQAAGVYDMSALTGVIWVYIPIILVMLVAFTLTCLVPTIIIDQRLGVGKALALSASVMMPRALAGFGVLLLAGFISAIGALACGIGMILTGPILYLTIGSFYYDSFIYPDQIARYSAQPVQEFPSSEFPQS